MSTKAFFLCDQFIYSHDLLCLIKLWYCKEKKEASQCFRLKKHVLTHLMHWNGFSKSLLCNSDFDILLSGNRQDSTTHSNILSAMLNSACFWKAWEYLPNKCVYIVSSHTCTKLAISSSPDSSLWIGQFCQSS